MRFLSIRCKLFVLIAGAVAAPVICFAVYFPATQRASTNADLSKKAVSFAHIVADQSRSAIAFDDGQTARETFEAIATDSDVTFAGLFRGDGSELYAMGQREGLMLNPTGQLQAVVGPRRVTVVAPVVSAEGPRGHLVVELSTARAQAELANALRTAALVCLLALGLGLGCAWFVGSSFGRRIERLHRDATRVEAGDLSDTSDVDRGADEIGQLSAGFAAMVRSLKRGYDSIEQRVIERTEALQASREQFRALVETTEAVPWEMEVATSRFTYVGPQAASLIGVPVADWMDGSWRKRVALEDAVTVLNALANSSTGQHEQSIEFRLERPEGGQLWVRMLISTAQSGGNTMLRGFMFDVTERAMMEAELRQAQKLESVGRLAAGVAHEINTPVQFVSDSIHFVRDAFGSISQLMKGYRELAPRTMAAGRGSGQVELGPVENGITATAAALETELLQLQEAEQDADLDYLLENVPAALNRSVEGLERVTMIVRSMKEFAHPDRDEKAAANVNRALASTLTIARNEYKDVAEVETSFGDLPDVACYLGELNQAFLNIVVNAAHAMDEGVKQGRRGLLRVTTRAEEDTALIIISDSGTGIPMDVRPRIFDPFFTTKAVGRGTGQGLAIARRSIVERHGGTITFESTLGEGTSFFIRIPLDRPTPTAAPV